MPAGVAWLSLKISENAASQNRGLKPGVFISVPKKTVSLATKRNRLRRLVREAVRVDDYFKRANKVYYFRVHRWPGDLALQDVIEKIKEIK